MNFKGFSLSNHGMQSLQCTMLWLGYWSLVITNLLWDQFLNYENPYVQFELCLLYNCQMKFLVQIICFFHIKCWLQVLILLICFCRVSQHYTSHQGVSYDFLIPFSTKVIYNLKSCVSKFPKHHFVPLQTTLCALEKCWCFSP
jgi:hypothetical protein